MNRTFTLLATLTLALTGCTGSPTPSPGRSASPGEPAPTTSADQARVVAQLLARPMRTPTLPTGGTCPVGDATDLHGAHLGPSSNLRLKIDLRTPDAEGLYDLKVIWFASAGYTGPIVVRVGSVDGRGRGAVRHYYDPAASRGDAVVFDLTNLDRSWPSGTFVSGPGCYTYQLDGVDVAEQVVFRVEQ
jgi:hypothetical protein